MNLIEQLGGYEAAKLIVSGALDFTHIDTYNGVEYFIYEKQDYIGCVDNVLTFNPRTKHNGSIVIQGGLDNYGAWHISINEIKSALLEYRRQHNIFEVGDLVVDTNYKDSDIQEVKSISGNRMNVFHKNKSYYFATFVFSFRHATEEEIKAGHRL